MTNVFFNPSGNPGDHASGLSAAIRAEFRAIGIAFDLMPQISTTGVFSTTFVQQGSYTFTLPALPGALAMLSDIATETTRATTAEGTNAAAIATNATAITTETARATAAEAANTAALSARAPLASPTFTVGVALSYTLPTLDHSNQAVSSTWVSDFLAASGFAPAGASPVITVAGRTGAVTLTHADITDLTHTDITDWTATVAAAVLPYAPITSIPPLLRGHLGGLGLSNDTVSPLLVLDIAAGTCTDSTNVTTITLGAFTKGIGGTWTAGSGNNGMGVGLSATALTWYHVFAAIVGGVRDVFFDTSVTAANKPPATTAFRRIGSIRLDAATHISGFTQTADWFYRAAPILEITGVVATTAAVTVTLAGVPPGVVTHAIMSGYGSDSVTSSDFYLSSLAQTDVAPAPGAATTMRCPLNNVGSFFAVVPTNTSGQIRRRSSTTGSQSLNVLTNGYIDTRGRG